MDGDFNEVRVMEVLVNEAGTPVALRVEVTWATRRGLDEPLVWDRSTVTVAAVGALADADVGHRLELRPVPGG